MGGFAKSVKKGFDDTANAVGNGVGTVADGLNVVGDGIGNVVDETKNGISFLSGEKQRMGEQKAKDAVKEQEKQLAAISKKQTVAKQTQVKKTLSFLGGRSDTQLGGSIGGATNLFKKKLLGE